MKTLRESLTSTETEMEQLEARVKEATKRIAHLQNTTDKLRTEYIKITSNSKSAAASANTATELAKSVEEKHGELQETYTKVKDLLESRETGNEERKDRAEALRKRATTLLSKIKRHNDDIESLKKNADSLDVELDGFRNGISTLGNDIEQVTQQIETRVNYHATCDA
jgi:chromosome segregation ATPase